MSQTPKKPCRSRKKPPWVANEIIRLKALQPQASCRWIEHLFNSQHGSKETVGRTFVAYTLKNHQYEIQVLRTKIKSRPAHAVPFNKTWGMDLTFVHQKSVLGLVEHHSRKCLGLVPLKQKSSVAILKVLLSILDKHPKPQQIRTDNEACFNSRLIRWALWCLGIPHQTTDKHCPWQNGRVERFFGTLKSTLAQFPVSITHAEVPYALYSFEFWYNHFRFHQNLNVQTPEAVYQQQVQKRPDG